MITSMRMHARQIVAISNRIDLGIKMNYAETLLKLGYVPSEYYSDYLEHIKSFNSFKENLPKKNSPQDFIKAYNSLIQSIRKDGFNLKNEKIMLSKSGELINGAHRVSVAAVLNLEIEVELTDYDNEVYDFEFFQAKKLPQHVLDNAALSQLKLHPEMKLLLVWPVANKVSETVIENLIAKKGIIFYKRAILADPNLVLNLKMINYYMYQNNDSKNWTGDSTNSFSGIREHAKKSFADGSGEIKLYLVSKISNVELIDLKKQLRDVINAGNYAVHSSDSIEESRDILQTINHKSSLNCARFNDLTKFPKLAEWLSAFNGEISQSGVDKNMICIGGSGPLGALGLRKINDLDVILNSSFKYLSNLSFVSNHDISDFHYGSSLCEFILDPSKNFSFLGFRFISLAELKTMKELRNEIPKDSRDLKIINKFEQKIFKKNSRSMLNRLKYFKAYWRLMYFLNLPRKTLQKIVYVLYSFKR
jgi:hypothetical protein